MSEPGPRSANGIVENLLSYLPHSKIMSYKKHEVIYDAKPPSHLCVIISGAVAIEYMPHPDVEVLVDIYKTDDLFGESTLIGCDVHEKALALEDTNIMSWSRDQVEEVVHGEPRLGVALVQTLTTRLMQLAQRIEGCSCENVGKRLVNPSSKVLLMAAQ